jgi:two-component system, NtrC family, response regulator AtoC
MEETIIGNSKSVEQLKKQIAKSAKGTKDVLLIGEPGVGKGFVARRIHFGQFGDTPARLGEPMMAGGNGQHPFLSVNVAMVDDRQLEAVLFGFETGAPGMPPTTKRGLFELSDNGTLLIEEVEEASFPNQKKILDFIRSRVTKRTGSDEGRTVNTRVILTVKSDPKELVSSQKLYPVLAAKLADFEPITILPLRDRPEDIPVLVKHFATQVSGDLGIRDVAIDINAIDALLKHPWKENIRELKAVIDRSILMSSNGTFVLPPELTDEKTEIVKIINNIISGQKPVLGSSLDVIEQGIIERALQRFGFDPSLAASFLGMSEQTLRYKLERLVISSSSHR